MLPNNSIFKFVNLEDEHAINNLKNNELLCKHFYDFNDPYEGHHGVTCTWPDPNNETEQLKNLISRLEPEQSHAITSSVLNMEKYINLKGNLSAPTIESITKLAEQTRLCSFTKKWNNILMWAHYSHGNRGVVLVFDQEKILKNATGRILNSQQELKDVTTSLDPVIYSENPPFINSVDIFESVRVKSQELSDKMGKEIYQCCMLTKAIDWQYEQEMRLILKCNNHMNLNPVLYKYKSNALTGVIIGNKCTKENILKVAKSVTGSVDLFFIKQGQSSYNYEIHDTVKALDIKSGRVRLAPIDRKPVYSKIPQMN